MCAALAVTGFVALVNEVVWTRILALVLGPTTYAFGVMVAIFITGLALGSAVMARLVGRLERPAMALATVLAAVAAAPAAVMWLVEPLALGVAGVAARHDTRFIDMFTMQALAAASLLFPLTIALGAAFPLGVQLAARIAPRPAARIAAVYAANTGGAIAGALGAGFLLIPRLGLQRTILAASALALAVSFISLIAARPLRRHALGAALAMLAAAGVIWRAPSWDTDLLSGGGYRYAAYVRTPRSRVGPPSRNGSLLSRGRGWHRRGAPPRRDDGALDRRQGRRVERRRHAHAEAARPPAAAAPPAIRGRSRSSAWAAASRSASALVHPIERVDTVEISPEVVRLRSYLRP